jgi:hypothetical protein
VKDYKLSIDLLPKGAWGNDLSKTLPKKDWDILRKKCYERANNRCQICGHITDELDAHEVWNFDIETKTQTLVDIVALCSKCHGVKHFRNSERLGFGENAKKHFLSVNKCSELEFASHCAEALLRYNERNEVYRWNIKANLSKFGGNGIEVKRRNIPLIENPYMAANWKDVKFSDRKLMFTIKDNHEGLGAPVVLSCDVNNYQGSITVVSNYANKIEWFLDNSLVQTKYNVAGKFTTIFKVEDIEGLSLHFKLTGDGGETESQVFRLFTK